MKKLNFLFFWGVLFSLLSCEYVEFNPPITDEELEIESNLILKSAQGFNSNLGTIYIQQGIGTGLKVEGKSSPVISASWVIEESNYEGIQVSHKFTTLGEVGLEVTAEFENGTSETRTFIVYCVVDISGADPVKVFTYDNSDGTWRVLFLFSKERVKYATDNNYYYNGLVTDWAKKTVPENFNYIIDKNGNPQITDDVGKYIGIKVILSARGLYNIALIHSYDNWTDLSGSAFIRSDNPGLAWFWFEGGEVIPQGDVLVDNLPGASGDNYFRFTQTSDDVSGDVTLFFKLENEFSNSDAFVVRQLEGGNYSDPISMWPVNDFPEWGQIQLPITEVLGVVSGFRYGLEKANPEIYSSNMKKSFFYDDFFKSLRLSIYKV
jgi:hypothetical protein